MFHSEVIINKGYKGLNPVQFGFEDCTPNHFFGPSVRHFWLLHYVTSGTGIFKREGKTHIVSPGEVFVIPPYIETYYQADKENPWKYIWVGFETDERLPDELTQNHVLRIAGVGNIFDSMRICKDMINGKSAFLAGKIWELLAIILETDISKTDYIERAIHCIHSEYMNDINASILADRLNLDRSYFSTLFTKKTGTPPSKYIMAFRLQTAADLMIKHGKTPSVAALSVGYTDIYNFSKAFKKKYGLSPRKYIENYSEKNKLNS